MPAQVKKLSLVQIFAICSMAILLVTTFIWAFLGACVQQGNADQLVDALLFNDYSTFIGAQFPGAHTFLFKWPIFWLINVMGCTATAYVYFTVIMCLAVVVSLLYLLHKIEKRPAVFGVICLALSSCLLLVPTQSYSGALLPVGMSMVTTRNLEYVLYILCIFLLSRQPSYKHKKFWLASIGFIVLFASDKLFLTISLVGALLALVIYGALRRKEMFWLSFAWLVSSVLAWVAAVLLLWLINYCGITDIVGTSDLAPYSVATSIYKIATGFAYAMLGIFANFGANPAFDAVSLKTVPALAWQRLTTFSGLAYVANFVFCCLAIFATVKMLLLSLRRKSSEDFTSRMPNKLSSIMIWSTIAAIIVFVMSNHYYPVDARYVSIGFFAAVISATTYYSTRPIKTKRLTFLSVILLFCIFAASFGAIQNYNKDIDAMNIVADRNIEVTEILKERDIKNLVGDYWRVIPIKTMLNSDQNVMPLFDCSQVRTSLISTQWKFDTSNSDFAYLLPLDVELASFPHCSLDQIKAAYGNPTSSVVISGAVSSPNELLLIYEHSASSGNDNQQTSDASKQNDLASLPSANCSSGAVVDIVAHEDDDILFMNPDIYSDISVGKCVTGVFLTAGDAGGNQDYWLGREKGAESAYAKMADVNDLWERRDIKMPSGQTATVSNLVERNGIFLIFLHLPDGNIDGQGFAATGYQSMASLLSGKITAIQTVDGQLYNKDQLVETLSGIIQKFSANTVRTQSAYTNKEHKDHSDHLAAADLTNQAFVLSGTSATSTLKHYLGYTTRQFAQNVTDSNLSSKMNIFLSYAQHDVAVCNSAEACMSSDTYGNYLKRQYEYSY